MQSNSKKQQFSADGSNANITSAVGLEETAGHLRARRNSLFTQTILWVTGLVCIALLLGSLAQAWSNSQLMQKVQVAQQQLQKAQENHKNLVQTVAHYKDSAVIENEARQQLGYAKAGEHIVIVVGTTNQGQQNQGQQTNVVEQQGFWQEWWHTFFGE